MGCAQSRLRTRVDVRSLESIVQTGDLILFSSMHAASHVTKCFTASTWDHCGIIVKFSAKHVFILEYAGGVFLYPLFTRLYTYYAIQGREIVLRRLLPGQERGVMQRRIEKFVYSVLGNKPPSIEEIVVAVLKQESFITPIVSRLAGGTKKDDEVKDDLQTLFCSKLIAAAYKDIGLLGKHRKTSDFLPKHFSVQYDDYLDLQGGALLGPELPVSFDSVSAEVEKIKQTIAEDERQRPEATMRAISKLYMAATSGVSDFGAEVSERFRSMERGLHGWSERADAAMSKALSMEQSSDAAGEVPSDGVDNDGDDARSSRASHSYSTSEPAMSRHVSSGGLQLQGGKFVDEILNVNDGGVYSPELQAASPLPPPMAGTQPGKEPLLPR